MCPYFKLFFYLAVIVIIVKMSVRYDEESRLILQTFGFLCSKPVRTGRHSARTTVSQVLGDVLNGVSCTLPWKGIKVNDQIVGINETLVEKLTNEEIRSLMLSACRSTSSALLKVDFTNANDEKKLTDKQEKIKQRNSDRNSRGTKVNNGLDKQEKRKQRNSDRKSRGTKVDNGLSPKDKKQIRNKSRERPSSSVKAKNG